MYIYIYIYALRDPEIVKSLPTYANNHMRTNSTCTYKVFQFESVC